jgi:hypothetical protein
MNRIVLFVVSLLAAVAMTGNAAAQSSSAPVGVQYQSGNGSGALCMNMFVPIDLADVPDAVIYGELCAPPNASPNTVELLVHGTNYDHFYWDWPANPHQYSHVGNAIDHGYATFNIDRIGTGWSTKPLSFTFPSSDWIQSLHQLVVGLRDGSIGGSPFANVVYFGSSLTVVQGWLLAEAYPGDIDAFIMTRSEPPDYANVLWSGANLHHSGLHGSQVLRFGLRLLGHREWFTPALLLS